MEGSSSRVLVYCQSLVVLVLYLLYGAWLQYSCGQLWRNTFNR